MPGELHPDAELLESTAWVHDVGYAPAVSTTGFHLLDGARYLRNIDAPHRMADLVAFHSSAWAESEEFGVAAELTEFQDERLLTRDRPLTRPKLKIVSRSALHAQ